MRGYVSTAAVTSSAVGHLWWYQTSARIVGRSPLRAQRLLQHWSRRTCHWLRLDVGLYGEPATAPCVYVSNHRSYLDIPVLSSVLGATFMSRGDVATWPVIGAAARAAGVVFVDRDDNGARVRAARALARVARSAPVVVFPEGTTGGAPLPGVFHPGLFRLVHRLAIPVVPVTLRYSDRRAYWIDDISVGEHLRGQVLRGERLHAAVHLGDTLAPAAYADAAELADTTFEAVCHPLRACGEVLGTTHGTAAHGHRAA